MRVDFDTPAPPRRTRPSAAVRLRDALSELAGGLARIERHAERNWASITFAGTRHTLDLAFEGAEAVQAGERLIDALPEHEFALPGQIVADASVVSIDHAMLPVPVMRVGVELLLLEDA